MSIDSQTEMRWSSKKKICSNIVLIFCESPDSSNQHRRPSGTKHSIIRKRRHSNLKTGEKKVKPFGRELYGTVSSNRLHSRLPQVASRFPGLSAGNSQWIDWFWVVLRDKKHEHEHETIDLFRTSCFNQCFVKGSFQSAY